MTRKRRLVLAVLFILVATAGISYTNHPASAQVSATPAFLVRECSETDYTKAIADTLDMSTSELRLSLLRGTTVEELAAAQGKTLQDVVTQFGTVLDRDILAAVSSGLITSAQGNTLRTQTTIRPGALIPAMNLPADTVGGISPVLGRGVLWGGLTLYSYNAVKPLLITAKALDLNCVDLVRQAQPNKPVILLAAQKNAQIQNVIDSLVNAYGAALDQDVKDGLLTKAQAEGQKVRLLERVVTQVSRNNMMVPRLAVTPVRSTLRPLPTVPARPSATPTVAR